MPKRLTNKEKCRRLGTGILQIIKDGKPHGRKDGSILTKPTIPCPDVLEAVVLKDVEEWLGKNRIMYDRNNTGVGQLNGMGNMYRYGIKSGGDIIGCLPNGIHFEIECKRGQGGEMNLDQQKRRTKVRQNNGIYLIVHSVEELECMMQEIDYA